MGRPGVAVGIATLNIVVVWLVGWVTHRVGGATASLTALAVTAGLVWTLGSELVYDPWQPNVLILTFWLVMCLVWATAADHVGMFPLLFGFATFALQTHLVFSYLVPVLLVFAVTCALARRWRRGPQRFADLRAPTRNSLIVLAVLWFQPLWEQFFGDGQGNMSRLLQTAVGGGSSGSETTTTGLALAVRQMGAVLALPPFWGRGGFNTSIPGSTWIDTPEGRVLSAPGLRTLGPTVIGLVVVIALIALAWWTVRRSDEQYLVPAFWTLAVALTTGFVTLVITPIDILGLSPHKARWLWVFGAFTTYLLVMAVLTTLTAQHRRRGARRGRRARCSRTRRHDPDLLQPVRAGVLQRRRSGHRRPPLAGRRLLRIRSRRARRRALRPGGNGLRRAVHLAGDGTARGEWRRSVRRESRRSCARSATAGWRHPTPTRHFR